MTKSLGDYNRERSSSDPNSIKWTLKNPADFRESKKRTKKKISPTNIIRTDKKIEEKQDRVFKVENNKNAQKSKGNTPGKKFQKSSAANCKIAPGFKRPGR